MVNGPGVRFVLWVQGCPIRCPGCFNREFWPFTPRHVVDIRDMAKQILSVPGIEGVTYTGGEPMAQAPALALLSETLREHGLTVVCYSGYTLEELRTKNDPWVNRLLANTDILIDGPFVESEAAALPWRGSRNQRVHFLTDRYRHLEPEVARPGTEMEFVVSDSGFTCTGILGEEFLRRLQAKLQGQ